MLKPIKRAVHFDFHTMPGIDNICENFDAEKFAQQMADANVGYINFFARCNIGFSYYPTKVGTQYPGLKINMLGDVVRECMNRGVLCLTAKDKVRLLPALNIPMEDLEYAIETIKAVAAELGGKA